MLRYKMIKEHLESEDIGKYTSFGIAAFDGVGNEILKISDVSLKRSIVAKLVRKCNRYKVSTVHIYDIIEDILP